MSVSMMSQSPMKILSSRQVFIETRSFEKSVHLQDMLIQNHVQDMFIKICARLHCG